MANKTEKSVVQLVIDGDRAKVSLGELGNAVQKARKELRLLKEADDPAAYAQKIAEMKKLNQEYLTQKERLGQVRTSYQKFMAGFKQMAVGVLGGNALTFAVEQLIAIIPDAINRTGKLSDELADVAKATDMTVSEVKALNREFKSMDTRTATKELRSMAEMGGKFGVAKDDILNFVSGTDKLNIALGDQFDSTEELADTTLKLRNILSDIKTDEIDQDVLHIGNAMNVLEAQGAASAKGMADFTSRMGGVLIPLGAASGEVIGLSATMEELSITAERGSTAVNTIFQKMLTDVEGFAKVAGMETKEFAALIEKDIFGAFVKFTEGTTKGGKSAIAFAELLKDTELTGSGASEVLLKLSSNTEMLADKVDTATKSLTETNSVMGEFNKKNNNAGAIIEKIGKLFSGTFAAMTSWIDPVIMKLGDWLGLVDKMGEQLAEFNAQQEKTLAAETKLPKLIARYETLAGKVTKTRDEQKELKDVTSQLADLVPTAVTEWDQYGNAMEVNATKARAFIEEQRALLETMRQTRREMLGQRVQELNSRADKLQAELNAGQTSHYIAGANGPIEVFDKLSEEDIARRRRELAEIQAQRHALAEDLQGLEGIDSIENRRNRRNNRTNSGSGGTAPAASTPANSTDTGSQPDKPKPDKPKPPKKEKDEDWEHWIDKYDEEQKRELDNLVKEQLEADETILKKRLLDELNKNALAVATGDMSTGEERQRKLDAEEEYWAAMYLIRDAYQVNTDEAEQQLAERTIERAQLTFDHEKALAEQRQELVEAQIQAEQQLADAKREALGAGVEALRGFFQESSLMAKGLFAMEKAIAIAQVIVNTQREVAGYYSAASAMQVQLAPVMGPAAVPFTMALATKQALGAKVRAGISIGTIGAQAIQAFIPGRREGGGTDLGSLQRRSQAAGYVNTPTLFDLGARSFIAGEERKMEYVIPYEMLQDPVVNATTQQLESMRVTGRRPNPGGGSGGSERMEALLLAQIEESRALRAALESGKIWTKFNYSNFEDFQTFIEYIRNETSV